MGPSFKGRTKLNYLSENRGPPLLSSCRVLQRFRQGVEPSLILRLQLNQLVYRVAPPLGPAAMVRWPPEPANRADSGASGTTASLTLGVSHRPLADRLA